MRGGFGAGHERVPTLARHPFVWLAAASVAITAASIAIAAAAGCGSAGPQADASPCDPVATNVPHAQGVHIPTTETPTYETNPPASGPHYPIWALWSRIYDQPVPRGYYVHNQEHGGVTILYNCPSGCPDVEADLAALVASLPRDPSCTSPRTGRWMVTPDPLLPPGVTVAAASWSAIYTASCVDFPTLTRFYNEHEGEGPEDSCAEGSYSPPAADAGPPADAGASDAGL
jgi:hypothetical protein